MAQIDILKKTQELKGHISQFTTASFLTQYYYLLNTNSRTEHKILKVNSPLRQIIYLASLFMGTENNSTKIFDAVTGDAKKIDSLLEDIENGYRNNYSESLTEADLSEETIKKYLMVATPTFMNYFSNGLPAKIHKTFF